MTVAQQLFHKAFSSSRGARSLAYKAGVLETLQFKEAGVKLKNKYQEGTAEADAWFAGNREGHDLWRYYREQEESHKQV